MRRSPPAIPAVLGPEADRLLAVACEDDPSAWPPLSDLLEGRGHLALATLARGDSCDRGLLLGILRWLRANHFDHDSMTVLLIRPPFRVDRRWIAWKSLESRPGYYHRAAIIMKGGGS